MTIEGEAEISDNKADSSTGNGGGVYNVNSDKVTIGGNAKITGNTAVDGGGVYNGINGTVTLQNNAEITGNTATGNNDSIPPGGYGGGVFNGYGGTFKMTGGAIHGNTAQSGAADFYHQDGGTTFTLRQTDGYTWYMDGGTDGRYSEDNQILYEIPEGTGSDVTYLIAVADQFTITAKAGEGGAITLESQGAENQDNSQKFTVARGNSPTFTIEANPGYEIKDVLVDDVSQGAVNTYTFDPVYSDHTIAATFTQSQLKGGGTEESPYLISTAEELAAFRDTVNSGYTDAHAVLTANIDLSEVCGKETGSWAPIGPDKDNTYTGTFDGGGHTIKGLYVDSEATYAGLFGVVGEGGTVKNLTVDGDVTNQGKFTGGVIGYNRGAVENCSFIGTVNGGGGGSSGIVTEIEDGGNYTGGVAGENFGTVADCCNTGAVEGIGDSSKHTYAGGVAGYNAYYDDGSGSGTITNCRNRGAVEGEGYFVRTGGVAGGNATNSTAEFVATITNCYNTGTVSNSGGTGNYIGGVAGRNTLTVENCYYLTGTGYPANGIGDNSGNGVATGKAETEFNSGEVAFLLNTGNDTAPWRQTLGSDDYPVLDASHGVVYQTENGNYTNDPPAAPEPEQPSSGGGSHRPARDDGPSTGHSDGWKDIREEI